MSSDKKPHTAIELLRKVEYKLSYIYWRLHVVYEDDIVEKINGTQVAEDVQRNKNEH